MEKGIPYDSGVLWGMCKLLTYSFLLGVLQFFTVSFGKIVVVVIFLTVFHYSSLQIRHFGALMCCLRKLSILRNLESFTTSNIQWQVAQGTFNTFIYLMSSTDSTVMIQLVLFVDLHSFVPSFLNNRHWKTFLDRFLKSRTINKFRGTIADFSRWKFRTKFGYEPGAPWHTMLNTNLLHLRTLCSTSTTLIALLLLKLLTNCILRPNCDKSEQNYAVYIWGSWSTTHIKTSRACS